MSSDLLVTTIRSLAGLDWFRKLFENCLNLYIWSWATSPAAVVYTQTCFPGGQSVGNGGSAS